jgi:aminoglycoside phosphotransferase (APT) family kinase protein
MRRAQMFLGQLEPSQSTAVRHRIKRLAERYDQVVERLLALPRTLIHGEFYASNVLVDGREEQARVCPVDWEMAALGPGLVDLAALTAGGWTAEEKAALSMAYFEEFEELMEHDGHLLDAEEFLIALEYCRLHLAVQWLGWAPEWSPPPEHAQDWLSEALSLAEKLVEVA